MTSKVRALVGAGLGSVAIGGATYLYLKHRISLNYTDIFTRFQHKPYYDRDGLKNELRDQLNRDTPGGIIFVCGRVNNGKTSLIKSVVQDRKYVAYMNWRTKADIWQSDKLVKDLKSTFKISSFFATLPGFAYVGGLFDVVPRMRGKDLDSERLEDVLQQIEDILRFSYEKSHTGDVRERPVIFIDEVHHLMPPDGKFSASSMKFINWLVEMTKDNHYCDVVVSTTDANSKALFSLSNPKYVSTVIVDDLRKEDFDIIVKEYWKEKGNGTKLHPWLGDKSVDAAFKEVGGTAGGVIDLCTTNSELGFHKKLRDLRRQEKERFDNLLTGANLKCGLLLRTRNCYTFQDFKKVANVLIEKGDGIDPQMPIGTLSRESKVPEDIIWMFIRNNYLFAQARDSNNKFPVMFSSKLFMDVYKEDLEPRLRGAKLVQQIDSLKASMLVRSFEFESDRQDYLRHIEELETELRSLGK
jgi:hypothetical protein